MSLTPKSLNEYQWPDANVRDVMDADDPRAALVSASVLECPWAEQLLEKADLLGGLTESPIETVLGAHLLAVLEGVKFCQQSELHLQDGGHILFIPQLKFNRYRFDFAFVVKDWGYPLVIVECDGKAFHASRDQMARDSKRDAEMRGYGTRVVRLWGTEIIRDPKSCVWRVLFALKAATTGIQQGC